MALLCPRTTPIDNHLPSPAEILHGRKIRGSLPVETRPRRQHVEVLPRLTERQDTQKAFYDRHATELPTLNPGQVIRVQHPQTARWEPATVINQRPEPQSYTIETDSGAVYRRNRRHLRSTSPSPTRHQKDVDPPVTSQATATSSPRAAGTPQRAGTVACLPTSRSGRVLRKPDRLNL